MKLKQKVDKSAKLSDYLMGDHSQVFLPDARFKPADHKKSSQTSPFSVNYSQAVCAQKMMKSVAIFISKDPHLYSVVGNENDPRNGTTLHHTNMKT